MKNQKYKGGQLSSVLPCVFGSVSGIIIILIGAAIMTESVNTSGDYGVIKMGTIIASVLGGFLGAAVSYLTGKGNGVPTAVITGVLMLFYVLAFAVFGTNGLQKGIISPVLCIMLGVVIFCCISIKRTRKSHFKKMRSR